jgi:crotonobetainyl-CoA:carnitine CoA-transferase CaiB-like acyl-CoA transferase
MEALEERPYAGLKVLDLSQGVSGPYCALILGQRGADVIKVEPPAGDWVRLMGGGRDGMTALAIASNPGKRSICVDAAQSAGREIILKLAERADIVVENFRPGVTAKLGLDYAGLSRANPGLIYVSITAFGETGPYAHKPGTDSVLQALTGMALVNKDPGGQPRRFGILVPDIATALYAAECVGAALFARGRARSGRGRHIRVSLAECCAAFQAGAILDDLLHSGQHRPPFTVPSGVFATCDGHAVLGTLRDAMWEGMCRALGREDWLAEPRYATGALRGECAAEINREVAAILPGRTTAEWAALFEQHDVLFAPVLNYQGFRDDPQVRHMGYFGQTDQAPYGKLPLPHIPGTARSGALPAAPHCGEHSREILAEFGYDAAQVAALEQAGLVVQAG